MKIKYFIPRTRISFLLYLKLSVLFRVWKHFPFHVTTIPSNNDWINRRYDIRDETFVSNEYIRVRRRSQSWRGRRREFPDVDGAFFVSLGKRSRIFPAAFRFPICSSPRRLVKPLPAESWIIVDSISEVVKTWIPMPVTVVTSATGVTLIFYIRQRPRGNWLVGGRRAGWIERGKNSRRGERTWGDEMRRSSSKGRLVSTNHASWLNFINFNN